MQLGGDAARPGREAGHAPGLAVSALVVALLATACTQVPQKAAQPAGDAPKASASADGGIDQVSEQRPPCTLASVVSCALPYPSDEFAVADPQTATGVRLQVPDGIVPRRVLDQLGPGGQLQDAFGGADGFSPMSPVVFELDAPVRPESVPPDGGDVFAVYDAATGERQPIRAHVWADAALRGAPATVVIAWPSLRWEHGHNYVARLRRLPGLLPQAPTPPVALLEGRGHLAGVTARIAAIDGTSPAEMLAATEFTIRSRANAVGGLEKMALIAGADEHPVRNLESRPPLWFSHGSAIVTGEVRITDFRDGDGVVDPDRAPTHSWVPFVLALPEKPATPRGAPVVVYGHGLVINKESMLIVASDNAAKGFATVGIDVPNHGGRQSGQGGHLLDLTKPRTLGRMVGVPPQGIVDHVSLMGAINVALASLDLAPWRPFGPPGDGRPDIDTSLILYEGTSMGGVLGVAEFALNPQIAGAFLQVPGVGILDILTHSSLWPLFASVIPPGASAGDAAAMLGAASMLLDLGESTLVLDRIVASGRPVFAQVGIGDSIVPDFASQRLVEMLGLSAVGGGVVAGSDPAAVGSDAGGRGYIEVWPNNSSPQTKGLMGHLTFDEPLARRMLHQWLDGHLAQAGLAGPD